MRFSITCLVIYYLFLIAYLCLWIFEHKVVNRKYYSEGEEIYVDVGSLTSNGNVMKYEYYSLLPYCRPQQVISQQSIDFGQKLIGDEVLNSPYRFRVNRNESLFLCTSNPLKKEEVELLRKMIHDDYQINLILDNMPALRLLTFSFGSYILKLQGVPIGYKEHQVDMEYLVNHLKFKIFLHEANQRTLDITMGGAKSEAKYEIVGFQVISSSVKEENRAMPNSKIRMYDTMKLDSCSIFQGCHQMIMENETVTFSYEVEFSTVNLTWSSRWDAYTEGQGIDIQWLSVVNSIITIIVITLFLFFRLLKKMRMKPLTCPELGEAQVVLHHGLLGGEIFRIGGNTGQVCPNFFCIIVANGLQIACVAVMTVMFSALGFLSESSRGDLLMLIVIFYLFSSIVAGYTGVFLQKYFIGSSEDWRFISCQSGCFFSCISFLIWTVVSIIHYTNGSNGFASIAVCSTIFLLWSCISFPLAILGGFLAPEYDKNGLLIQVSFGKSSKPKLTQEIKSWILSIIAGFIPFSMMFVQLHYIMSSICHRNSYNTFNVLFVVMFLIVIACAEVSTLLTYRCLSCKDKRWWLKAFFASGSSGFFFLIYSLKYFMINLGGLFDTASLAVYVSYSLLAGFAIILSTGSVGFLSTLCFLRILQSNYSHAVN